MAGIFIAMISGILMSVQGVFNTDVTKTTGMWVANSWVQLSAFATCLIVWGACDRSSFAQLWKVEPKYILLGGVFGAGITYTVMKSMEKLGPAKAVIIIVAAQIIAAYLIELFGWFGTKRVDFDVKKLIGMAIVIAGIILFRWEKE